MVKIQGAKGGGGGGHTPIESPDSLLAESTAKILLAISEGEIAGGLDDTRIFLDDTPIGNADGSKNFEGVTWEFRPGSEHQEYIQGIPSVDNEIAVGMELKDDQPYVRSINNTQLSAVRIRFSVPQFMQQHDNGDTMGYRVDYVIELSTDGSGYKEVIKSAFDGKTTSEYPRTHRIELPKANTGWQVRVRRLTKNQNNARIADKITIAAIVEVIDAKLRYPNTALLFITFNARQFNNRIPKISVRPQGGLLIKVPVNYDPINRTYSGIWDGTFKLAATNNPAWVYYDLVLNNRYGCGDRITASQIEKWDLYKIAQYCDEMVPDGRGGDGKEPRFLCDVYIQSQEAAYTVLRDIAAIFRGMTFWADNKVNAVADMPESIFRTFTNANIVGGKPAYSGGSIQNRYTQALVSFTDIDNHSNDDVEAVADLKLQRRYGVRKTELSAIGCTRRSEANRRGRWALLTNANDRMVTFATGLEGAIPSPGHIIGLADSTLAGRDTGGRISAVDGRKITLDRTTSIKAGDRLIVNLPDGKSEGRTVTAVNQKVVTVSVEYSQVPQKEAVWVVDSDDLAIQLYRVINISDNGDNTYTISGAIHNPDNYDHIDSGARIDERPITVIPPKVQPAPKNVRISSYSQIDQGIAFTTLRVDWEAAESAITYEMQWRRDNGNWINAPRTSTLGFEVNGIYAGRYQVRVRAINASEISSIWANADETQLNGKEGNPPKPLNLRATSEVWGITLDWGFDVNTSDTLKTELQYSSENTAESMQLLADVPYPLKSYRMSGLKAGIRFYFRGRLVDKSGNQSEWTNVVLGESSADTEGILTIAGENFLSKEAGQQMQSQIDLTKEQIEVIALEQLEIKQDIVDIDEKTIELDTTTKELSKKTVEIESSALDVSNKVLQLDTDVSIVSEAVMQNTVSLNQVTFRLMEEEGTRKAEILDVREIIIDDQKAFARYQSQVSSQFEFVGADVYNLQQSLATTNEAFAQQMSQVRADLNTTNEGMGKIAARVTTNEEATANLEKSQAKLEQVTLAEFEYQRAYINQISTAFSDSQMSISESVMQLSAQHTSLHDRTLKAEAKITKTEKAVADESKARAEMGVQMDARFGDAEGAIARLDEVQSEQGKTFAQTTEQLRSEIKQGDDKLQEGLDNQGRELSTISSAVETQKQTLADLEQTTTQVKEEQQSNYNELHSNIVNLQQTQANESAANAESTLQIAAQVNNLNDKQLASEAHIRRNDKAIAEQELALAKSETELLAKVGDNAARIAEVDKTVSDLESTTAEHAKEISAQFEETDAKLLENQQAIASEKEARALSEQGLNARIGKAESSIAQSFEAISEVDKAQSEKSEQLKTELDGSLAIINEHSKALTTLEESTTELGQQQISQYEETQSSIAQLQQTVANAEAASAESVLQTAAQTTLLHDENLKVNARVTHQESVIVDQNKAQAKLEEKVDAQYADNQASIIEIKQSVAEQGQSHAEKTEQVRAELKKDIDKNTGEIDKTNNALSGVSAAVTTNTKAIAATNETLTEKTEQATSRFEDNEASLANVQKTQANADNTSAETTLQLAVQQNQQGTELLRAKASIRETNKIVVDNDKAYTQKFTQLDSQFEQVNARLTRIDETLADNTQAIAKSHEQLSAKLGATDENLAKTQAQVDTQKEAIAKQDQAIAKVNTDLSTRIGQAESSISDNKQAISDNEQALADFSQLTKAEFEDQKAAIEQRAKTSVDQNGNASSIFSIKNAVVVNGQYYEAQMIIGAEVKNGEVTTQIGFSADTFGIFNPASGKLEPVFFVENGQVFINEAFIQQATIEKLLIGSTIKSKHWDPETKKGLMLDFNSGKIIASDAEITGEINATSGTFSNVTIEKNCDVKGRIYANQIEGDVLRVHSIPFDGSITLPAEEFERTLVIPALTVSTGESTQFSQISWRVEVKINGRTVISFSPVSSVTGTRSASGGDKYNVYAITGGATSGAGIIYANETALISYKIVGSVSGYELIHQIPAQCLVFKS